jgi:hypothetical protein
LVQVSFFLLDVGFAHVLFLGLKESEAIG